VVVGEQGGYPGVFEWFVLWSSFSFSSTSPLSFLCFSRSFLFLPFFLDVEFLSVVVLQLSFPLCCLLPSRSFIAFPSLLAFIQRADEQNDSCFPHPHLIVDFWEGINEPSVGTAAACKWVNDFEVSRQTILKNNSLHAVVGSFAAGTPNVSRPEEVKAFLPALALAKKLNNWLGVHEFSAPYLAAGFDNTSNVGKLTGHYRDLYKKFLTPHYEVPLVVSAVGIDGSLIGGSGGWKGYASAQGFADQLAWYDSILMADSYVKGATIFLLVRFLCVPGHPRFRESDSLSCGPQDGTSAYDSFSVNSACSLIVKYMNGVK
jgi:hypothetical protein